MSSRVPLNQKAVDLFTSAFGEGSKILVLGGTGWFGRTALAMLAHINVRTHIVASTTREFSVDGRKLLAASWDAAEVARFEPETVLDFAYLTVDKSASVGLETYKRVNRDLADQLFFAANLPSTRRVLTISSGASVRLPFAMRGQPAADAYAEGKRSVEAALERIASSGETSVSVARAWSVSGGHVQNPRGYAFSGMITDALEQRLIRVRADRLVYRRYSAVEELLALALSRSEVGRLHVIDSGGPLVEVGELAFLVSSAITGSRIEHGVGHRDLQSDDSYVADSQAWDEELSSRGLRPLGLHEQIENVITALSSGTSTRRG